MSRYLGKFSLLLPMMVAKGTDAGLTLFFQPKNYWSGDYSTPIEANEVVRPILESGPLVFVAYCVVYTAILALIALAVRPWLARRFVLFIVLIHSTAAMTWIVYESIDRGIPHELFAWPWCIMIASLTLYGIEKSIADERASVEKASSSK